MHPNEELITKFYSAFQSKMETQWQIPTSPMQCFRILSFKFKRERSRRYVAYVSRKRTKSFDSFFNVKADDMKGSADWEADYSFSKTGRMVYNKIHAEFTFQDRKDQNS
jgi:hypothetical protein